MKPFIFVFILLVSKLTHANDLAGISLITPTSYTFDRTFGETTASKAMVLSAGVIRVDIKKKVLDKIKPYERDLLPFFSNKTEYDNYINNTINSGINTHLKDVNDANLQKLLSHIGNNLIGGIADKVMSSQGITKKENRDRWTTKLTQPFNNCMKLAKNAMFDGLHCVNALTSSVVPSMGVAIVYETSEDKLTSGLKPIEKRAFNHDRVDEYNACLKFNKTVSSSVVMDCAVSSIATGVKSAALPSLLKSINGKASSINRAHEIRNEVWPVFSRCTEAVGKIKTDKTPIAIQFNNCLDNLVTSTGKIIVEDTIRNTKAVKDAFGVANTAVMAQAKASAFEICARQQKKDNRRDSSGMIDIGPCETIVTNDVTYDVVVHTLRDSAKSSFPNNTSRSNSVATKGVNLLKACWKPTQTEAQREKCLKNTITSYAQDIASIKIDEAITGNLPGKNQIKTQALSSLQACLRKELPSNISKSSTVTKDIDKCSQSLTKNIAHTVAEAQVRESAKGLMTPQEINRLVDQKVKGDFSKCIGNTPTDAKLKQCGDDLTVDAATEISKIAFQKEIDKFIQENGGLSALGLTKQEVDQFLARLNTETKECIEKRSSAPKIDQVNACLKNSIKSIATYLGDAKFNQSIGKMYDSRPDEKEKFRKDFKANLNTCLSTKDAKEFSIEDYTKNISACSNSIEKSTTQTLATDQVDTSLNEYLKDRPGMDNSAKRLTLRKNLLNEFNSCNKKPGAKTNQCVDELKRNATKDIVLSYGRDETLAQLSTKVIPLEIKKIETDFVTCTLADLEGAALATKLDECTRDYAISFAKELGVLKLNFALKNGLGSEDFTSNQQVINSAIIDYKQCLDDLKVYTMADNLTDRIAVCTKQFENRGMSIVSNTFSKWMSSDKKDAATLMIKNSFASFMPCLSILLPSSPYTPEMAANVDSIMKPVMKLLASYIEYDPENAQQTLAGIMERLKIDLNDTSSSLKAKAEILDMIYKEGALDKFLQSAVRSEVKGAFDKISDKEIPAEVKAALLDKDNFNLIFNSEEGNKIKDDMMKDFLTPVLLQNQNINSPEMKEKMDTMQSRIIKLLVEAPSFGEKAMKANIQGHINQMGGLKKFFAKAIYGKSSLDWDKVSKTPAGIAAEEYIAKHMLLPKFTGKKGDPAEEAKIAAEAERLVTEAVKNYKKN